jgi:hypothetical protein
VVHAISSAEFQLLPGPVDGGSGQELALRSRASSQVRAQDDVE